MLYMHTSTRFCFVHVCERSQDSTRELAVTWGNTVVIKLDLSNKANNSDVTKGLKTSIMLVVTQSSCTESTRAG